jgi:hypothetical protein
LGLLDFSQSGNDFEDENIVNQQEKEATRRKLKAKNRRRSF